MTKAKKLRELIKGRGVCRVAGGHDGLSAKLVQKNGFNAVWASGFEIAASFAVPDANILTMSQNLERACEINDATDIAVIADCDTGFGNSNNVIHMVKKYEAAGIAAVCIEDKKFPKVNSFVAGRQELASISEFVGKIMAAKNSQTSPDFMVIARVEALIAGRPIPEAIERAEAYVLAGADAILIHSKEREQSQIIEFCRLWKKKAPLVIVPTKYPDFSEKQLRDLGIKIVIFANQGIRAAARAMDDTFASISRNKGKDHLDHNIASMDFMFELQGMNRMKQEEQVYLRDGLQDVEAVILAAGEPNYQKDMMSLLNDIPPVMLDINGKTLLQRNIDCLNSLGVSNIFAVTGYESAKVNAQGLKKIVNKDYKVSYILDSMMKAKSYLSGKVLLMYGDVMFDKSVIEAMVKRNEDIVLALDASFKHSPNNNHTLELVKIKKGTHSSLRSLGKRPVTISEISSGLPRNEADFEFIGLALFSKKGFKDFCRQYVLTKNKYAGRKFHAASSFKKASFTDMINEMVKNDFFVHTAEVNSGWIEIHTFDNYKLACASVGR